MRPVGRARPLLIGDGWFPDQAGGLTRYLTDLHGALTADGGVAPAVVLLGPVDRPPAGGTVAAHLTDPRWKRLVALARSVVNQCDGDTVIDSHFALNGFLPSVVARTRRLPLVVHFQGPWADESVNARQVGRRSRWIRSRIERAVYRRAHTVITLSTAFRRMVIERYGVDPWRVRVIPPGVDLDRFTPGDRLDARTRLGIDSSRFLVVSVRRLVPRMGLEDLVHAVANIPDVTLRIVGEGPERSLLNSLIAELGVTERIALVGAVADRTLVDYYRAADVTAIPTREMEGFGLVALESLAAGTPVIASDCDGLRDALADFAGPQLVPAGDVDALTASLERAREAPESLPPASECRAHAERFGWPDVAAKHRRIYSRAVSEESQDTLRVTYLDHTGEPSGAELALLRVLPALEERVSAHVVVGADGPFVDLLEDAGHSVELLAMGRSAGNIRRASLGRLPLGSVAALAGYTLRLARLFRRTRPDVVHTNTLKAALIGGVAGRFARVPVIWHVHDRITPDYLPARAVRGVLLASRHLPSGIICNSETTRATLGDPGMPVRTIGCALDPAIQPAGASEQTTLGGEELRFGLVGRLAGWKGQDVFLRAFAEAFPDGRHQAVLIGADLFGEGEWVAHIERLIADLELTDRVDLRGHCADIAAEYRNLDVLVHASTLPEPFGQVVTEGLAAGLPVLAVNEGGPAEIIGSSGVALTYPMGDHVALAQLMGRVVEDPALRTKLAAAGPDAAKPFAADVIAAELSEFYAEVIARSGH